VRKCKSAAPLVLFYGASGSIERSWLPTGSTVTVASEATWRSMITSDFARYDLVVIGDPDGATGTLATSAQLQAAYDTRLAWNAAITGRIVVLGNDPGYHAAKGTAGAATFLRATLNWLSTGPTGTTALYVTSDGGQRKLDYLGGFGAFGSTGLGTDTVTITVATHPIMLGSTSATLSTWTTSNHSMISFPPSFTAIATATDPGSWLGTPTTGPNVVVRDAASCIP
jgi:hypothetical protein